ncbi:MAG: hypothetical protein A2Z34_05705 [Planctomycetes bacterium RBG_16_59_8]|nr:MAG: hypothetical protein A2Z34_05705 [Planctomycetes bacterium RBG_16_59_8]
MPKGKGWWISPSGEIVEIFEHYMFVQERPELFGFPRADTLKWKSTDRDKILAKAIGRGWIRVRNEEYETWELTPKAVSRIAKHLRITGADPGDPIRISELKFGRWIHVRAGDVRPGGDFSEWNRATLLARERHE